MKTILYAISDKEELISLLKEGKILAFPTDTVFGLGCIADETAVDSVYEAKGRSFDKALPMMCDSLEMVKKYAVVGKRAEKIIRRFTPGPLTIVLKKKKTVSDLITKGKDTIAIRIPDDAFVLNLIREMKQPLMVTSANISGNGSLLKWEDVLSSMKGKIDGIVCEDAKGSVASSIIDVSGRCIKMLREGPLSLSEIKEALK
ncbi:MAG: threonylcarbamoyl-AMP synthase [Erysipelotrichaceae bacterium]|nr:threonylcarbamoyl-AMP synthase [Erysipelotrichaceae bacterium]